MGTPAMTSVAAQQEASAVVLQWRELFASLEERVFRVYRRSSPGSSWSRVAEVKLPAGNGGTYRDIAPLAADMAQYGVTQVGACGEGQLCVGPAPAQQCNIADVARRER